MSQEIVINNPNRSRKFGWSWACSPTGRDAYSIETPTRPQVTGTIKMIQAEIAGDPTFRSIKSGGAFYNTAWFYDGKRITATWSFGLIKQADDLPLPDDWNGPEADTYHARNNDHHSKNDNYGYAWFSGLDLDSELWENGQLKIRVIDNA